MRTLSGKRVLITGAGSGLGRALAVRFHHAGAHVIVTDQDGASAEAVAAELRSTAQRLDVTDAADVRAGRKQVLTDGLIDVLVNNAGVVFGGPFADVPLDRHRTTINVNLAGLLAATHAFLPDLIGRPESHLVNIVSASAFVPLPWGASYAATKWAVLGFTESLREELRLLGHRHVGVTAICPSFITTGLFAGAVPPRFTGWLTPEAVADATVRAVLRRQALVVLPRRAHLMLRVAGVLPWSLWRKAAAWTRVSTSMTRWRGRA